MKEDSNKNKKTGTSVKSKKLISSKNQKLADSHQQAFVFEPIAFVESAFADKFGIPRQSGMLKNLKAYIQFINDPDIKTALRSIEMFSHIWLVFVFDQHGGNKWKPSIRPPRLGGAKKVGVLSSRSPHRPNPIGISAVQLISIDYEYSQGPRMCVAGIDLLDTTAILDVKPYIPIADSIPEAIPGWANEPIIKQKVIFSAQAEQDFAAAQFEQQEHIQQQSADFRKMLIEILELDPRPAYMKRKHPVDAPASDQLSYGMDILGYEIKYKIESSSFKVLSITKIT